MTSAQPQPQGRALGLGGTNSWGEAVWEGEGGTRAEHPQTPQPLSRTGSSLCGPLGPVSLLLSFPVHLSEEGRPAGASILPRPAQAPVPPSTHGHFQL